jgi:acylphosphatase
MATAHWIVVGKVQGVGFRWFVREQARRWGVRGWVRNRPDGSVEIAASGPAESLDGLLAAVKRGPEGAAVSDVRAGDVAPAHELPEPFSILRG